MKTRNFNNTEMQETITTIALKTKFKEEHIPALMEIVQATANPSIAIEILLGIYQEPTLRERAIYQENNYRYEACLMSFNPWTNEVSHKTLNHVRTDRSLNKDVYTKLIEERPELKDRMTWSHYIYALAEDEPEAEIFKFSKDWNDNERTYVGEFKLQKTPLMEEDMFDLPRFTAVYEEKIRTCSRERWEEMCDRYDELGGTPFQDAGVIAMTHSQE